jgi:hypothetical protein
VEAGHRPLCCFRDFARPAQTLARPFLWASLCLNPAFAGTALLAGRWGGSGGPTRMYGRPPLSLFGPTFRCGPSIWVGGRGKYRGHLSTRLGGGLLRSVPVSEHGASLSHCPIHPCDIRHLSRTRDPSPMLDRPRRRARVTFQITASVPHVTLLPRLVRCRVLDARQSELVVAFDQNSKIRKTQDHVERDQ